MSPHGARGTFAEVFHPAIIESISLPFMSLNIRNSLQIISCCLTVIIASCSKQETFLGNTIFQSKINIQAYVPANNSYFKIAIDDSIWSKVKVENTSNLTEIFSYSAVPPPSGKSHIQIWWKNTDILLVDTIIALKGINTFYLIQLDKSQPPKFFINFGEETSTTPDSSQVLARIYYTRDSSDATPFPDSIRIEFFRLAKIGTTYEHEEDTSLVVSEGLVSGYIALPNTYYYSQPAHGGLEVSVGYEIYDAATGIKLQDFCPTYQYGTLELSSTINGKYEWKKTLSFDYLPHASGCNFGDPTEEYLMKILFGGN
jgi:hypothetical protein